MSLPRNEDSELIQEQPTSNPPYLTLNDLWEQMLTMRQDSAEDAEDKFQVSLLLATVNKLRAEQETFMSKVESKLNLIDSNQLRTISLQEEYQNGIRDDERKLLNTLYHNIREEQDKILNENLQKNTEAYEQMTAKAKTCKDDIDTAVRHVQATTKNMFRITSIGDLIYYIAPVAVIFDAILHAIEHFL